MRRPFLAGNWKMNLDRRSARELAQAVREHVGEGAPYDAAVFPSFVYLDEIARCLAGSAVGCGAQNVCDEPSGAFTGEVSCAMVKDVGADSTLVGHSERRHVYGEGDDLVNRKVLAARSAHRGRNLLRSRRFLRLSAIGGHEHVQGHRDRCRRPAWRALGAARQLDEQ
jgi:triosephosphate isomerase